jgi:hypothetical protein
MYQEVFVMNTITLPVKLDRTLEQRTFRKNMINTKSLTTILTISCPLCTMCR